MKFRFDPTIPAAVRPEIDKFLLPLEWLVPAWCHSLWITWDEEGRNGDSMASGIDYEYRHGTIKFYPSWLGQTEQGKREDVIHEILHCFASVLTNWMGAVIKRLVPEDEKFRDTLLEELRQRDEGFVQDFAHCLADHLPPTPALDPNSSDASV